LAKKKKTKNLQGKKKSLIFFFQAATGTKTSQKQNDRRFDSKQIFYGPWKIHFSISVELYHFLRRKRLISSPGTYRIGIMFFEFKRA